MQRYVILDKKVGETPLACMEAWRATQPPCYQNLPLTYAGRLDPLASGALLVLIGEACKRKDYYLGLDKTYDFSLLFGVASDSGDVLGLVASHNTTTVTDSSLKSALGASQGTLTLPYPAFSSKPVAGKPLHTWAAEGRLDEITIPSTTTEVYSLKLRGSETLRRDEVYARAQAKIDSIPPVTDLRKALGNDFRREDIRARWQQWRSTVSADAHFTLAHCRIVCSSGTYLRSLATHIGAACESNALAFSIHRTRLGRYRQFGPLHYWSPSFALSSAWRAK